MAPNTTETTTTDLANVTPRRRELAVNWHGGQASMLYAIASTGALTRGTRRPSVSTTARGEGMVHRPMTDSEWAEDLLHRLWCELQDIVSGDHASDLDAGVALPWQADIAAAISRIPADD